MVKSCREIRSGQSKASAAKQQVRRCRIAPERLEWRRSQMPKTERELAQKVDSDLDHTFPVSTQELDAVRRLLGNDLDLFLRTLSGH
jgi:hypothetical protein